MKTDHSNELNNQSAEHAKDKKNQFDQLTHERKMALEAADE